MDTLCGVGLPELIVLALVAFVVIGPERSQEIALKLGRFLRSMMRSAWWHEFNQVTRALRDLPGTLVRMAELEEAQIEIKSMQDDLRRTLGDIERDTQTSPDRASPPSRVPDPYENPWGIDSAEYQATVRSPTRTDKPGSEPSVPKQAGSTEGRNG